jgi:enamine deaminase RidA (YjgF/YER057c/UK114 family)
VILLISGTASIDECGKSVHIGDLRAQLRRTFSNIAGLLESEGCTWHDIVRTTCYLRDIDRDYEAFNEERTAFYQELGLDPLPASTGIEAKLCRPELLVEIEAIAMFLKEGQTKRIRLKASLDGQPPSGRSERKLSLTDPKRKSRIRSSSVTHWLKACQTTERQKILHDR